LEPHIFYKWFGDKNTADRTGKIIDIKNNIQNNIQNNNYKMINKDEVLLK